MTYHFQKVLKFVFFLLLFVSAFTPVRAAKPDSIHVYGSVSDAFSKETIEGAVLTFMRPDSTVVHTDSTSRNSNSHFGNIDFYSPGGLYSCQLPGAGDYLVKVAHDGYATKVFNLNIPVRKYMKWTREQNEDFLIERRRKVHEVQLGDAVVKATKIKMVLKGDTVIFNADAFQLSEGSMLEQLINQLPGMKLGDGGNITYNGEHITSLLVNGKDFFKGNPKIALENLPAYMVNKVKVYRRSEGDDYLKKDTAEIKKNRKLVVDVNLKRQYNQGWLANAEVAGGTADRYLARMFAMRFTDHSKLFLFGNMNNTNTTQIPGEQGDWENNWTPAGTLKLHLGGANLNWDDKDSKANAHSNFIVTHEATDDEQISSSVKYLDSGDTYSRSHSRQTNRQTHLDWNNFFEYPGLKSYAYFNSSIQYFRIEGEGTNRSATFSADPKDASRSASLDSIFAPAGNSRLNKILINNLDNPTGSLSKEFSALGSLYGSTTSPILGNHISLYLDGSYNHKDNDIFSLYDLKQPQAGQTDFRNQYTQQPTRSYRYSAQLGYNWNFSRLPKMYCQLNYSYEQTYDQGRRNLYRLDSLDGWNSSDAHSLGQLPSTTDSLHAALDWSNSYFTTNRGHRHTAKANISYSFGDAGYLSFEMPLNFLYNSISDRRNRITREKTRNTTTYSPSLSFWQDRTRNNATTSNIFSYQYDLNATDMSNLLDVVDAANPLVVQMGNPNLKNTGSHRFRLSCMRNKSKRQRVMNFSANWNVTENAVAQTTTYDRTTGVSTYKPKNINGNWDSGLSFSYEQNIDTLDRIHLRTSTSANYNNNVDYTSERNGETTDPYRSSVHNLSISENLSATYSFKKIRAEVHGNVDWSNQTSSRENFNNMNTVDFTYGITLHTPLIWGLDFSTDLNMHSRRGYNDKTMNDNNLVWNAELTRSFLKGKNLILKLDGFDILGQLDNVRTEMNAQGRTETWYNTIPRYAMLHLIYRLNIKPKAKKQ